MSSENTPISKKPLGKRLLRFVLIFLAILIGIELFYRLFWKDPPMTEVVYGNHPTYHHLPSILMTEGTGKMDMRGNRYSVERKPGVVRIAFLGDSFTYGFTPANETIPYDLSNFLKEAYPDQKFEILNFGFVSYSPIIEELVYHDLVKPLNPDIVFLLYDTFDPQDDVLYAKSATFDPETGRAVQIAGEQFLRTGFRWFSAVRFIQYSVEVLRNGWHYLPEEQRFENRYHFLVDPLIYPDVIAHSFGIIKRLSKEVERNGSRFALFQYPPPHLLKDRSEFQAFLSPWVIPQDWEPPAQSAFGRLVMEFCEKESIFCYNFGPEVRAMEEALGNTGSRLTIYNNLDGHFTGEANLRFARFILDRMKDQNWLPSPPK